MTEMPERIVASVHEEQDGVARRVYRVWAVHDVGTRYVREDIADARELKELRERDALRAELESLKHDIARHVAIASEEATRAEEAQRELLAERMFRATAVARLVGYVQGISGDVPILDSDPMEFIERMRAGLRKEVAAFDEAARALAQRAGRE